jgi:hypothetical protein
MKARKNAYNIYDVNYGGYFTPTSKDKNLQIQTAVYDRILINGYKSPDEIRKMRRNLGKI